MEHAPAVPFEVARSWRNAALIASAIAAAELLAILIGAVVVFAHPVRHHATAAQPARKHATPAKPKTRPRPLARARTAILVLNGNGRTGAAGLEATVVRARGYPVSAVGNSPVRSTGPSTVMYRPGYDREARRLAHDLGLTRVGPLDGIKLRQVGRARLVVIVGD
jgi:hypothetical protein